MSLKALEIESFKSFADKTEISFPDRVTAIVGPNGCGKSNITDAIKWVLGDTKPTSLRSSGKSSLIFNGTDHRAPHNSCQVILKIDNSKRYIPLNEDEIIIRKRITKTGLTEVFINERPCKITEIQELLRDTGIGKDGYSMVSQNKVYDIISSSAKNRRIIFEEAVGIATYKKKKLAAKTKLDKTDENISRTELICNEIQNNIDPLENDAKIAKQARELLDKQKTEEVNQYIYQKENEKEIIGDFNDQIEKLNNEIQNLNREIIENKDKYDENLLEIRKIEFNIEALQSEEKEYYVLQEKVKGHNTLLNERLTNLQKELSNSERVLKEQKESKEKNLDREQKEEYTISKLKVEIVALENIISNLEENIEKTKLEIRNLEEKAGDSQNETYDNIAMIAAIKEDKAKYETELKMLIESIRTKNIELEDLKEKLKELQKEQIKLQEDIQVNDKNIVKVVKLKSELRDTIRELTKEKDDLTNLMSENKARLSASNEKLRTLKAYKEEYSGCSNVIRRLMQESKNEPEIEDKIEGLVLELLRVPEKIEMAINVTLGPRAQNIVVRNPNDATKIVDFLKRKQIGVVTLLPITTYRKRDLEPQFRDCVNMKGVIGIASELVEFDKRYENVFSGLLGRVVIVDNLETAKTVANKYKQSFRIVTLDGDTIETSGAISGGFRSRDNSINLFETDRSIDELEKLIKLLNNSIQNEEKRLEEIKESLETSLYEESQVEKDVSSREIKIAQSKERFEANKLQENTLIDKISNLEKDIELTIARRNNIRDGLEALKNGDKDINDIKMNDKTKEINIQLSKLRDENEKIALQLSSSKVEYQKKISDLEISETNLENVKNQILNSTALIEEAEVVIESSSSDIEVLKEELANAIMTEEEREKLEKIKNQTTEQKELKEKKEHENSKLLQDRDEIGSAINNKSLKINVLSMNLEKARTDMIELENYIKDQYNLDYEDCVAYKVEDFVFDGSKERIQSIKKKIAQLGNVNYAAIEAYEREKLRLDRLIEQLDDLKIAKNKLESLIFDLSQSMLEKFNRDFEKINANFQDIFSELFNGGKAKLILQDLEIGQDELERGIDIIAEPPGKKITSINSLSGGEQTLTAIAILFAIIKVKIVPFCVLDEIDAALDDANVALFAQYLRNFKKETQFIIITHRRPTMELADKLNGITMEERGVSKVARCSIEKAVDLLNEDSKKAK